VVAKDLESKQKNPANFSYFNSRHGLPNSVVRDVLVDRLGHLWIATAGGVCRYDGHTFYIYTKKQGLLINDITALFEDKDGNIWFGSYGGTLSRFDGKKLTQYRCRDKTILCMTQDSKGNLWCGTKEGGVYYFDGEAFHDIGLDQGFVPKNVNTIIENADGNFWIGTSEGIFIAEGSKIYRTGVSAPCGAMTLDGRGHLWFAIQNEVYHYDGSGYVQWIPSGCSIQSYISKLYFDSFEVLWIGTDQNAVARFDGKTLRMFDQESGFPGGRIENIIQDKAGSIWIGCSEGVCHYGGNLFTHYIENNGKAFSNIRVVYYDSRGRLWLNTDGTSGVLCIDGDQIFHYGPEQGFPFAKP
jgi:ligand-binding sensor domain-containing protein